MSGWSSPITRRTSSGRVTSAGWKLSMLTTRSRVAGVTVACSCSLPAMCSRKSSVDQSVMSDPTMVNPGWQQLGLGQLGDRRQQQAAGQITGSSEEDHALDHGVTPFSARRGSSV